MCFITQVLHWLLLSSGGVPSIFMKMKGKEEFHSSFTVMTLLKFNYYFFCYFQSCWETRTHLWIWWILRVPVLLTISVNTFALLLKFYSYLKMVWYFTSPGVR